MAQAIQVGGKDFGTTTSAIAIVTPKGYVRMIQWQNGQPFIPTAIQYPDGGEPIVGPSPKRAAKLRPDEVVLAIKRYIEDRDWRFQRNGKELTSVDVAADIMRYLREEAEAQIGHTIDYFCLTTPNRHGPEGRQRTQVAAQQAGIENLRIINEPVAAAHAYHIHHQQGQTVLVFDLGGGTFDVSILKIGKEGIEVLAHGGDKWLGGRDFDEKLVERCRGLFREKHGKDPLDDALAAKRYAEEVEAAKIELSEQTEQVLDLSAHGQPMETTITRAQYETLIAPLVERAFEIVQQTLEQAGLTPTDVDAVLPVGNPTRTPLIQTRLAEFFDRQPNHDVEPELAVAKGAAIRAALDQGLTVRTEEGFQILEPGHTLSERISRSIGIYAIDRHSKKPVNDILIARGSKLPAKAVAYYTSGDEAHDIKGLRVRILQGESEDPNSDDVITLGAEEGYVITDLPPMAGGEHRVRVEKKIDESGVLHVKAVEEISGKRLQIQIEDDRIVGGGEEGGEEAEEESNGDDEGTG